MLVAPEPGGTDRRLGVAAAGAVVIFLLVIVAVPAFYPSYDELKYFSIGANLWAGRGPVTAFGDLFLLHAPLWMAAVYAPQALFGIDAAVWGHVLNAAAGAGIIALVAVMGRRSSPLAGVLAAFGMLAFTYLLNLSRTARLDVPVAFLALLYLEVGWRAVASGSTRRALAAGAIFAAAVWIKEVPIPLAPVPMLCGVLAGAPWARLLRVAGLTTLAAIVGLAPWFWYYAATTGRVYRLGTPAWTLVLALGPLIALVAVGLGSNRLAASPAITRRLDRLGDTLPAVRRHGRAIVGWGGAVAWTVLFLLFFSRVARLGGASILQLSQLRHNFQTWAFDLVPIGLFAVTGLVLAIVMLATDPSSRQRLGTRNALVASIVGSSLIVFVMAVGEPPRNYIAEVGTAVAMAAGSWAWLIDRLVTRTVGDPASSVRARRAVLAVAAAVIAVGTLAVGGRAWLTRAGTGTAAPTAAQTAATWVKANVPAGTTVAIGAYLAYDTAYKLVADYPLVQLDARLATVDPAYPMGLRSGTEPPASDWVSADPAPKNVNQFEAFRATWIRDAIAKSHVAYWVYATGSDTAAPSILNQLTPDHGFTTVASWTYKTRAEPITITIFRVAATAQPDPNRLYLTPDGVHRLADQLARFGADARDAASTLAGRLVVRPESPAAIPALQELQRLAGG